MKKELAFRFAFWQGCNLTEGPTIEPEDGPKVETKLDIILKEIFDVDPISGLPKGDISYYLTENGNPQVKEWIEKNLLQPRSSLRGDDPQKVSDDLIVEFSRQSGETNEAYAARLSAIRMEAEENIKKYQDKNVCL